MTSTELRCAQGKLFGVIVDGVLEVRCQSKFCGRQSGVVVLHRFNLETGEMLGTRRFKDPAITKRGNNGHS